ncbi:vacuolar ATPase assembly integral membrane protein vma21 [Cadophora malorum]|uniref:Vacuolar ATPase assembly integral membrane protein vma21 n=1 Tax=Cadophora malorum TaxID=108018 RepID=A0A8H7WL58_9HELO|nr:vacuolar ATPase assembly integral membrane protein vma21 [Cadophora malorum]
MATRRNVPGEKTPLEKELSQNLGEKSIITPAVPGHVIFKLLGFTLAMVVCPIGSYFLTLNTIFKGNSTWAGATAAIIANVVLIGYVLVAFNEDQTEVLEAAENEKRESKKGI